MQNKQKLLHKLHQKVNSGPDEDELFKEPAADDSRRRRRGQRFLFGAKNICILIFFSIFCRLNKLWKFHVEFQVQDPTAYRRRFFFKRTSVYCTIPSLKANRITSLQRWRQRWCNVVQNDVESFNDLQMKFLICIYANQRHSDAKTSRKEKNSHAKIFCADLIGWWSLCICYVDEPFTTFELPFLMLCADPGRNSALIEVHLIMQISSWKIIASCSNRHQDHCFASSTTTSSEYFNILAMLEIERFFLWMLSRWIQMSLFTH